MEDKNHMTISVDAEKLCTKFNIHLWLKTLIKIDIYRIYLNIIKSTYHKTIANIILNGEKQKTFPLKSGTRQSTHSNNFYLM